MASLIHFILSSVKIDFLIINIIIKSFNTTPVSLAYPSGLVSENKIISKVLTASPFGASIIFEIDDLSNLKNLRLNLGDSSNTLFIEGFYTSKKHLSHSKYLYAWNGIDSISKIFHLSSSTHIEDQTSSYIQIETTAGSNFIDLDPIFLRSLLSTTSSKSFNKEFWLLSYVFPVLILLSINFNKLDFKPKAQIGSNKTAHSVFPLSIIFFCLLFVFFVNSIFIIIPDLNNSENRKLNSMPHLNLKNMYKYPEQITDYTKDHFAFRNYLFFMQSYLHAKIFNTSILPNVSLLTSSGWFFFNDLGIQHDYRKITQIDTTKDSYILSNFIQRKKWLEKMNCKFCVFTP